MNMNFDDIKIFKSNSIYRLGDLLFRRDNWHKIAVVIQSQKEYRNTILHRYMYESTSFLSSKPNYYRAVDNTYGMVDLNVLLDIVDNMHTVLEPDTLYINIRAGDIIDLKETRSMHFIHKPVSVYQQVLDEIKHNKNINKIKIVTALHYGDKPNNSKKFRYQFTDASKNHNITKIKHIVDFIGNITKLPVELNSYSTGSDFEIIDSDFLTLLKNKNVILEPIGGFASLIRICRHVIHNNAEILEHYYPEQHTPSDGKFVSRYNKNPYLLGFFAWCSVHLFNIIKWVEHNRNVPDVKMSGFNLYTSHNDGSRWFKPDNKHVIDPVSTTTKDIKLNAKTKYCDNNYSITTKYIKRWFEPSDEVVNRKNYFINQYNIDPSNTLCLYYRGTDTSDRGIGVTYFNVYIENVLSYIHEFGHEVKTILLQSDDQMFVDFILSQNIPLPVKIINEIPSTYSNIGFHFEHKNDQTTLADNAVDMLAVVNIMAQCHTVFCTTSNVSKWICLYRGNTSNVFQFQHNILVI